MADKKDKNNSGNQHAGNLDIEKLSQSAPYSQYIHHLRTKSKLESLENAMQYSWSTNASTKLDSEIDSISIESIQLGKSDTTGRKKRSKTNTTEGQKRQSKAEGLIKPTSDKMEKESKDTKGGEANKPESKSTKKKKAVAKKKNESSTAKPLKTADKGQVQTQVKLDDFTIWLNSLLAEAKNKPSDPKKVKKKKKKSSGPKAGKNKKKSDEIKSLIEDSLEEKDDIATESLAKLYEQQGYYEKAIEVYENLRLKFPEKSSFFAAQIKKLKDKI